MASLVWSGKNNRGLTRRDCAAGASGTSYLWTGAPYPLRWLSGGLYQLELRPMSAGGGEAPLLAKSPFFSISDQAKVSGSTTGSSGAPVGWFQHLSLAASQHRPRLTRPLRLQKSTTVVDSPSGGASGISKPVAIGVGVAIGVPSVAGTVVVMWCLRKRKRAALEKRRLKRREFVIS